MTNCMICRTPLRSAPEDIVVANDCPRCGRWQIIPPKNERTWPLHEQLGQGGNEELKRSRLSHKVRRMGRDGYVVGVPLDDLEQWGLGDPLPNPMEQVGDLLLLVGDQLPTGAHRTTIDDLFLCAWLGTIISEREPTVGLKWLLNQDHVKRWIVAQPTGDKRQYWLTWEGWSRYEELKREESASSLAFMAMQFGDDELNRVVADCFRPAVADTGFTLNLLTDGQGAGCIDDQLRVAIRTCRFVLADLTHNNRGAYWEAGFAEGLGKPVIYTCKKSVWDSEPVHFDTSHLVTIIWDPSDLYDAAKRLKATIRATLPEAAKMTD